MTDTVPAPNVPNWQLLYEPTAIAICIKDDPPMTGFGKPIKQGDVVKVDGMCWDGRHQIAVKEQCAMYDLEGYFEPAIDPDARDAGATPDCAELRRQVETFGRLLLMAHTRITRSCLCGECVDCKLGTEIGNALNETAAALAATETKETP